MMVRRRKTHSSGEGGSHWLCFSDLMSSLVMVFIMAMLCSMYQYYDMFYQTVSYTHLSASSFVMMTSE